MEPTLHLPVPLQTRVKIDPQYLNRESIGTVAGIAQLHVVFQYIVVLDEPFEFDGETHTAITVAGPHLMDLEGRYAWRLDP